MGEYMRCCTPENIHGVCEDYRAAISVDFEMDRADFEAGRRIDCPVLVLWGERSHVERHFAPMEAWQAHASNLVGGRRLPSGHYPAEQCRTRPRRSSCGSLGTEGGDGAEAPLDGKVALITGAVRRMRRAIALALAGDGAAVVINTRSSREEAEALVAEIEGHGGRALVALADVTEEAAVQAMVDRNNRAIRPDRHPDQQRRRPAAGAAHRDQPRRMAAHHRDHRRWRLSVCPGMPAGPWLPAAAGRWSASAG